MALRPRQLNRRETAFERQARQEEKQMFRTLEECKRKAESHSEIPKNDRLELREQIHRQNRELLQLFRRQRKNPSKRCSMSETLQNLQIALRKYLLRLKQEKEGQILKGLKEQLMNNYEKIPPTRQKSRSQKKPLTYNASESNLGKPRWFRKVLEQSEAQRKRASRSIKDLAGSNSNSRSQLHGLKEFEVCSPSGLKSSISYSTPQSPANISRHFNNNCLRSGKGQFEKKPGFEAGNMSLAVSPKLADQSARYSQTSSFNFYSPTPSPFGSDLPTSNSNINVSKLNLSQTKPEISSPSAPSDLFTDPKMLEECRGFLSKTRTHEPVSSFVFSFPQQARTVESQFGTFSQNSLCLTPRGQQKFTKDMFQFFRGKDAEDVVSWFFDESPSISRKDFSMRMREFLSANALPEQAEAKIDACFDVLSGVKARETSFPEQVTISQLGLVCDQLCLRSRTNTEVSNLFRKLDSQDLGRLVRCLFSESKWTSLFAKADYDEKGYIGYWELFNVRRSWEYMNFLLWHRQHSTLTSTELRVGSTQLY